MYCSYPSLLCYNDLLLAELLYSVLLCLACLSLQRLFRYSSLLDLIVCGTLLGLAAMTRSSLWLFPPLESNSISAVF